MSFRFRSQNFIKYIPFSRKQHINHTSENWLFMDNFQLLQQPFSTCLLNNIANFFLFYYMPNIVKCHILYNMYICVFCTGQSHQLFCTPYPQLSLSSGCSRSSGSYKTGTFSFTARVKTQYNIFKEFATWLYYLNKIGLVPPA